MNRLFPFPHVKHIVLLFFFAAISQAVLSQSGSVKRSWAFAKEIFYGRELRDLEGKPVQRTDTAYFFYLETSGKNTPQVSSVTHKGRVYHAAVHAVPEKEIVTGTEKATNKKFTLKKGVANRLWLVELSLSAERAPPQTYISVKGRVGRHNFSLRFKKFVLLLADDVG